MSSAHSPLYQTKADARGDLHRPGPCGTPVRLQRHDAHIGSVRHHISGRGIPRLRPPRITAPANARPLANVSACLRATASRSAIPHVAMPCRKTSAIGSRCWQSPWCPTAVSRLISSPAVAKFQPRPISWLRHRLDNPGGWNMRDMLADDMAGMPQKNVAFRRTRTRSKGKSKQDHALETRADTRAVIRGVPRRRRQGQLERMTAKILAGRRGSRLRGHRRLKPCR